VIVGMPYDPTDYRRVLFIAHDFVLDARVRFQLVLVGPPVFLAQLMALWASGLYLGTYRYSGIGDLLTIGRAIVMAIGAGWLAILCDGKHAERHPIFRGRLGLRLAQRDRLGLLNVLGFRAHRLVSVVHRAIFVINIVSVAVIDGLRPAVIAPAGESRPRGTGPVTESWIVRIVDVIVVPPTIAVPITNIAPIILPIVSNVAQVLLAPILPLASVGNSAWKILYVVTRTSGSTEIWLSRPAAIHTVSGLTR